MSNFTSEQVSEYLGNLSKIQSRVAVLCRMPADWISAQVNTSREHTGWAFVVGRECIFLTDEEALHDPNDDAFIRQLATQVMGYEPDSLQDYQARKEVARDMINKLRMEIGELDKRRQYWMEVEADLLGNIALLEVEQERHKFQRPPLD